MSLFSSITDALDIPSTDSIGDDNSSLSAEQNNPLLSGAVLAMRTAYDGIHAGFQSVIQGKKSSLRQLDKYIDNWLDVLNRVVKKYEELLGKINEMSTDMSGAVTLDFAKEAWEIIQDTPILRRYLGEANYWYLYDTIGLLSNQYGSISAEAMSGIKEAIKQAILATLSATEGLISLQTYSGYLQSMWGFLYLKSFAHMTLDSVLPQVTTAYWYKSPIPSMSMGEKHAFLLNNEPPGNGFVPIPVPIPDPRMAVREPSYINKFNPQNPDTWYLEGIPYYMPNSMNMLHKALQYWGSSYTNAINVPNAIYPRRPYDGANSRKPLQVGSTLSQLDTDKMSVSGTNIIVAEDGQSAVDLKRMLSSVFTPTMLGTEETPGPMVQWRVAYRNAYRIVLNYIYSFYDSNDAPKTITEFWSTHGSEYNEWIAGDSNEASMLRYHVAEMLDAQRLMKSVYANDNGMMLSEVTYELVFDSVMKVLVESARSTSGFDFSIADNETFMVGSSNDVAISESLTQEMGWMLGVPHVAYKVDMSKGSVEYISSGEDTVKDGDSVNVEYPVTSPAFVMFPSNETTDSIALSRWIKFSAVPQSLQSTLIEVTEGTNLHGYVDSGILMEYIPPFGSEGLSQLELGEIPNSLYRHRSNGLGRNKTLLDESGNEVGIYLGNIFFPNGEIPKSIDMPEAPMTFLDVYESFVGGMQSATVELADVVGYSINRGRESKFPCFGIYGNLICMSSWNYREMLYSSFASQFHPIKSGSRLYYKVSDPSQVVLYHSSYFSQSRQVQIAVYHGSVASESKSYGLNDTYTYYVFPGESIAVSKLTHTNGYNLGMLLSTDAVGTDGTRYHYTIIKNPIPYSPKYVDPTEWSFMDVVYEMVILAYNLSGLCGDNGKRLQQLEEDLKDFGLTIPRFLGELPENNGQYVDFKFDIMEMYSRKIEVALNSVYTFRDKLVVATNAL